MAKLEQKYCKNCKGLTYHTWVYDRDSEPEEPEFELVCVTCGAIYTPPAFPMQVLSSEDYDKISDGKS